jgi:hypothetical protein
LKRREFCSRRFCYGGRSCANRIGSAQVIRSLIAKRGDIEQRRSLRFQFAAQDSHKPLAPRTSVRAGGSQLFGSRAQFPRPSLKGRICDEWRLVYFRYSISIFR